MSKNQSALGVFILLAGVVILLGKLGVFSFIGTVFWPLFILVPGILLHVLFFSRMLPSWVLIPAGILTTYGLIFQICNWFGFDLMMYLWPFFMFGVAIGLYEYYWFEPHRPKGIFLASMILTIISAVFFGISLLWGAGIYFVAIVLIIVGAFLIYRRPRLW